MVFGDSLYLVFAEEVIPTTASLGWIVATCVVAITSALGLILRWVFSVHLPEKERQYQALLDSTEKERVRREREIAEEREKDRIARHDITNKFQEAMAHLLEKHELDAEKDRTAFMQRSTDANTAFRERSEELKDAIISQTHAFEKALENGMARIALAMSSICEASAYASVKHRRTLEQHKQDPVTPPVTSKEIRP